MTPAMSSAMMRRSLSRGGTREETIILARPSTIAVFPTPGSPMRTGLLFLRLQSTWTTLAISFSRPITGSSWSEVARAVRSRQKNSSAEVVSSSGFSSRGRGMFWSSATAFSRTAPLSRRRVAAMQLLTVMRPSRRCSVPTTGWPSMLACLFASCSTRRALVVHPTSDVGMEIPEGFLM